MAVEGGRLVVVAAHPDDETLGTGGFLQAARAAGAHIELVVATDGEAAFGAPDERAAPHPFARNCGPRSASSASTTCRAPPRPARLRPGGRATTSSSPRSRRCWRARDTALAPWTGDPHPDHAAAGHAVLAAATAATHRWAYPIWTLPWSTPEEQAIPWPHAAVFTLDASAAAAKRRAVGRFTSQIGGPEPILAAEVLAHFDSGQELFFRVPRTGSAPVSRFADLYGGGGDPWQTRTSWYERRKRDVVLACLPAAPLPARGRARLRPGAADRGARRSLRPGDRLRPRRPRPPTPRGSSRPTTSPCSPRRCPTATRSPTTPTSSCSARCSTTCRPSDAAQVADRIPLGADVVLVHWRGWPAEAPRDAAATHRQLTDDPRFATLVEHVDESFLLHVLRRR